MPELPEVETVKNDLKNIVIGKTISKVTVNYEPIIRNMKPSEFSEALVGESFIDIRRKGKYLLFLLNDLILVSHLRMEGKYLLKGEEEVQKHEHIIFYFTDGTSLRYNDVRKFGTMNLFKTTDINLVLESEPLKRVGFDPFEEQLKAETIYQKFQKISKPIKSTLLDQTIISGLGNIYVDEICFMSRIHPLTSTKNLTMEEVSALLDNARTVLTKAINLGGTTIRSFSSHEISGRFQNELLIHTKKVCPVCQQKVQKIRVGGRGTYLCSNCQKLLDKYTEK
ncbi:MAG: DNA-formamidopyrimidine glycosylase [Acholeplasmataceae bacterium]|nr:DNA-formamidopyrimidine glycosylase [Acholeplasmataceae bacterium]